MGRGFSQGAGSSIMGQGLMGAGRGLVGPRLSLIGLGGGCGSGYGFNSLGRDLREASPDGSGWTLRERVGLKMSGRSPRGWGRAELQGSSLMGLGFSVGML